MQVNAAQVTTEQRRSQVPEEDLHLLRRIQQLARRAERTAHDHSNFVGPPPSQEHLDILAEIRALTETQLSVSSKSVLPRQPDPTRPVRA
jgi:hypothetical protein